MLSQYGVPNITNLLSFVFGFGNGIALYTLDIAFFIFLTLIYGESLANIILLAIFAFFTHLLPVRFFEPITLVGVENGSLISMGVNGIKNESECMLIGFFGIIINFVIPRHPMPLFIAGYSMAVTTNPF